RMARSMETEHMLDQPCDAFACPSPVGRLTAPAAPERSRASDQARRFGLARRGGAMGDSDGSTEHHGGQTAAHAGGTRSWLTTCPQSLELIELTTSRRCRGAVPSTWCTHCVGQWTKCTETRHLNCDRCCRR